MNPQRSSSALLRAGFVFFVLAAPWSLVIAQTEGGPTVDDAKAVMASGGMQEMLLGSDMLIEMGEQSVPQIRAVLDTAPNEWVKIGVLRALAQLGADEGNEAALITLITSDLPTDARIAAIRLAESFARSEPIRNALADALDRSYDPQVKVALATTLHDVGGSAAKARARTELKQLLASENREFRIWGALGLAEIKDYDSARGMLAEIQDDPTPEGQLARAYGRIERLQQMLANREERGMAQQPSDNLDLLREIIAMVKSEHLVGEQLQGKEGDEKLLSAAAKGMLAYLDPHSTYMSPSEYERWLLDLNREYAGIGAYVNTLNGSFQIDRPIYSGPAYAIGLRSDDVILKVDGWDTLNQPQEETIKRLKGEPGSFVEVEVFRSGWKEPRKFKIQRQVIQIDSVFWELFPGGIGYVEVLTFGEHTAEEVHQACEALVARGAKAFVLDLRYNPGGYMRAAIEIVGEFVGPNKLAVYTEGRHAQTDRRDYMTPRNAVGRTEPMVVLINDRSASASEIVSGALKFYERATLVGERTFGKGSVQNPYSLVTQPAEPVEFDANRNQSWDPGETFRDLNGNGKYDFGGIVKLTTQRYFLPSGRSIHTEIDLDGRIVMQGGIEPDDKAKFVGTAPWKEEELADLIQKETFKKYVDEHFPGHEKLFVELAEGDNADASKYPDFDKFYASLETRLDQNEVRKWLRRQIRDKVADQRAKPFPGNGFLGDYQEDNQLQLGLVTLLRKLGLDPASIPSYAKFASIQADPTVEPKPGESAKKDG